jgi:hypothetical protein
MAPKAPRAWLVYWRGPTFERFELEPRVAQFAIDVQRRLRAIGPGTAAAIADRAAFCERLEGLVAELKFERGDADAEASVRMLAADIAIVALGAAESVGGLMEGWTP